MKLYVRDEIDELKGLVFQMLTVLERLMEENLHTFMPGFTHLQKAQPITLAHHLGAYFEMFRRDYDRLTDIRKRMNTCPLGSGALAGTTYPLDRAYTAELLGFESHLQQYGFCGRPGLSDRAFVCPFNNYDAPEPFLGRSYSVEFQ